MKKYTIPFFLLILIIGCADKRSTPRELVTEYYDAFNSSDFNRINNVTADSITIIDGDCVTLYTRESFYEQFKWDSTFRTTYQIVAMEEEGDQIIATVASGSKRYKFLKNDPLTCKFRISFNATEITKLESLGCPGADWKVWETERDSLVNWTKRNNPELDGFIHDLSMKGAINYLKAIELYENRNAAR
ncbi:MAG: hypothetical protein AAFQ94_20945 [Bacteroidota bacterium]